MDSRDVFLLEMIVDFSDRIDNTLRKTGISRETFLEDLDLQDMLAFRVAQIGEYVNDLSDQFKNRHPEIEWHKIVGFRNIVDHAYGSVNMKLLWNIVSTNIPELRLFCAKQIGK